MIERWRALLDGPRFLAPDDGADLEAAFDEECAETNRQRLVLFMALMVLAHLAHVWGFWVDGAERALLAPTLVAWRDGIAWIHAVTAVCAALFGGLAALSPSRWMPTVALAAATLYLLHAAAVGGVDQLNAPTIAPYLAYALVIAIALIVRPTRAIGVYLLGLVALYTALFTFQADPEIRRTFLPQGPTVTLACVVIARYLYLGRRTDFWQRRVIAAQQAQLERMNEDLSHQVAAQVDTLLERANQVESLNLRLRQQVRDRSRELAEAMDKLADRGLAAAPSMRGRLFDDRFEVLELLGRGGMGAVYVGLDRMTSERVAIKVIREDRRVPLELLRRFVQEAEAVARIHHPAIVRMLHIDITSDGTLYQVQELVPGLPLDVVLQRHGTLPPAIVARLLQVLATALAAAHEQSVVHRDVKPANVILSPQPPGLKLLDFGIARVRDSIEGLPDELETLGATEAPGLTRSGLVIGTPGYMPPEQELGASQVSPRSDVYSIGVLGMVCLLGGLPDDHPDRQLSFDEVPSRLRLALAHCRHAIPGKRPTAAEVAVTFGAAADDLGADRDLHVAVQLLLRHEGSGATTVIPA